MSSNACTPLSECEVQVPSQNTTPENRENFSQGAPEILEPNFSIEQRLANLHEQTLVMGRRLLAPAGEPTQESPAEGMVQNLAADPPNRVEGALVLVPPGQLDPFSPP